MRLYISLMLILSLALNQALALSNPPTSTEKQYLAFKNELLNPGFEGGKTGWTVTTTAFTITTTAGEFAEGTRGAEWNPAGAESLKSPSWTVKTNAGGNGVGFCRVRSNADADYDLEIYDVTNAVVVAEVDIPASTTFLNIPVNFVGVSNTAYRVQVSSAGNDDEIQVDSCGIGYAEGYNIANVNQASLYGSIRYAVTASCTWSTVSASYGDYTADTDCPTPTVTGYASAPGTKIPGLTFANLPPGDYFVISNGFFAPNSTSVAANVAFQFSDGTNAFGSATAAGGGGSSGDPLASSVLTGRLSVTAAQTNITIQVQGKTSSGSNAAIVGNSTAAQNNHFEIQVYRFPSASQQVYAASTSNWRVDANIAGANDTFTTSAVSTYTGIENSGWTLTNNTDVGTLTAQIPCSSTNAPSGTTCSAGDESIGVSWVLPKPGKVKACVGFATSIASSSDGYGIFQIVETPNNAQTISQEGKERIDGGANALAVNDTIHVPYRVCGNFYFSSAGQKTLRLMFEKPAGSGTFSLMADASSSNGQRDIHWEVHPLDENSPAPNIVNTVVTKDDTTPWQFLSAKVTSADAVSDESGEWITGNCTDATVGEASCIFGFTWRQTPTCLCTARAGASAVENSCFINAVSTTQVDIRTSNNNVMTDVHFTLLCMGPK